MYRSKIIHLTHVIFHFFVNKEDSTLIKLYTIAVINISNLNEKFINCLTFCYKVYTLKM